MGNDDILRKIEGLLNKANGTDSEPEAQAFFAKASELMIKYAIDEQRVREAMGAKVATEQPVMVDFMYAGSDSNAVGKKHLLDMVAAAHSVQMIDYSNARYSNMHRPGNSGIASQWSALVGFAGDIELVKMLYTSLFVQAARFAHVDWKLQSRGNMPSRIFTGLSLIHI